MRKFRFMFVAALLLAGSTITFAQQAAEMKPIHQFVDGFNKGDIKSALAACSEATAIIDEFPPHLWTGDGACQKWANDYDSDAKKNGITDGWVTLGKATHFEVNGDLAYGVIPSSYTYKHKGKKTGQFGSFFSFVLSRGAAGWTITAWSWATKG